MPWCPDVGMQRPRCVHGRRSVGGQTRGHPNIGEDGQYMHTHTSRCNMPICCGDEHKVACILFG